MRLIKATLVVWAMAALLAPAWGREVVIAGPDLHLTFTDCENLTFHCTDVPDIEVTINGEFEPSPPAPDASDWAKWAKATAERVIDSKTRRAEAQKLASSIESSVAASAAGVFSSAKEFRQALRSANRRALGEPAWAIWNQEFDKLLTAEVLKLKPKLELEDQAAMRRLYAEVAKGLREVS